MIVRKSILLGSIIGIFLNSCNCLPTPFRCITKNTTKPGYFESMDAYAAPSKPSRQSRNARRLKPWVKHNVGNGFSKCTRHKQFALIGAHKQRVAHLVNVQEGRPISWCGRNWIAITHLLDCATIRWAGAVQVSKLPRCWKAAKNKRNANALVKIFPISPARFSPARREISACNPLLRPKPMVANTR